MQYTLWSRGRMIGHTDLAFADFTPGTKGGWFHPTEIGETIIPVIAGASRVALEHRQVSHATLKADLASVADRIDALDLELRDERGEIVQANDIGITDTELTLEFAKLGDARDASLLNDIDDDDILELFELEDDVVAESWEEPDWPRYQIVVSLGKRGG